MSKIALNSQQQRLLVFELNRNGEGSFSIPMLFKFSDRLNTRVLKNSVEFLLKHHQIFKIKIDRKSLSFTRSTELNPVEVIKMLNESEVDSFIKKECQQKIAIDSEYLYRFLIIESDTSTYLFFNIHHIIWDGTSTSIFLSNLKKVYESLVAGIEPSIKKESELKYDDYIVRQKAYQNNLPEGFSDFFQNLPLPEIPIDKFRKKENLSFGEMTDFKISKNRVEKFCQAHEITPYVLFASVFSILVHRYTALESFHLGVPLLGRFCREDLNSLGFYASTSLLPIKINLSSTLKTINNIKDSVNQHRSFSRVGFEKIKEAFSGEVYKIFYMYQDFSLKKFEMAGIEYERIHLNSGLPHSDLDLWIANYADHIEGGFHFSPDLFLPETVERFQEDFLFILNNLTEESDKALQEIGLSLEHKAALSAFGHGKKDEFEDSWLVRFEQFAEKYSSEVAIETKHSQMTYQELSSYSSKIASYLRSQFSKPEIIAVELSRSPKLIGVLLGILKAGFTYLPIDLKFPNERISYMKDYAKAVYTFTDESLKEIENEFGNYGQDNESEVSVRNSAYVIFTSGSTGLPKGVEISLRAMSNFLFAMKNELNIKKTDTLCAVTTLSFDISVLEIFLPLICGAKIYLADDEEAKSPDKLVQIIESRNITFMQATPTTWKLMLSFGWKGKTDLNALCGGEKLPFELVNSLDGKVAKLWNMYGPTETTVWSTLKEIELGGNFISVGKPISNTELLVLDNSDNMVPVGAVGELLIGGLGVANGYLFDQAKTKEKFISVGNKIFYRTGDLARYTGKGEVQILGRNDTQVKIRGFRIELEEIEYKIKSYDGVKDCVCAVQEVDKQTKALIAFCVVDAGNLDEKNIRSFLKARLPYYMIPDQFKIIDSVPLTPNRKVDRNQLESQIVAVATRQGSSPETEVEKKIAEIWRVQLNRNLIYKGDNFFEIGGNSMIAMRIFHEIENFYHCNLELSELFQFPRLEDLAKRIQVVLETGKKEFSNLLKLKEGSEKNQVFFFHAIGGNILNYKVFVDSIRDYRCFGLQSTGVDGYNIKMSSIRELAESYAEYLLNLAGNAPFVLVGGSMGGILAYEVGKILNEHHKTVKRVIMFDTAVPTTNLDNIEQSNRKIKKGFRSFGIDQVKRRFLGVMNTIFQLFNRPLPMIFRGPLLEFYNFMATRNYTPSKSNIDIYLIRIPLKKHGQHSKRDLGWGDYTTGSIEVDYVDAPHDEFVESPEVAKIFSQYLRKI